MFLLSDESINYTIKVVGMISINESEFFELENSIARLRFKERYFEEIKWNTFSVDSIEFYKKLIPLFFKFRSARFHSNSFLTEHDQYKVSYRLIESISWKLNDENIKEDFNIIFDETSKGLEELEMTQKYLKLSGRFHHNLLCCNQVDSKSFNTLQLADLLTGSLAYKLNLGNDSKCQKHIAKNTFIRKLEELDENLQLDIPASHALYQRWDYFERKIQHYNLHLNHFKRFVP